MKKILTLVVVVALVATISVAGTLAWLTAESQEVVNTFTVGNVGVKLDEDLTDAYGAIVYKEDGETTKTDTNTYKLIPGHEYNKNPTVHVQMGSEGCHVFIKVSNGIKDFEKKNNNNKTIAAQMDYYGWELYNNNTDGIYYYTGQESVAIGYEDEEGTVVGHVVDALNATKDVDLPVFKTFTIDGEANTAEGWADINADNAITIKACVVQALGVTPGDAYTQAATLLNAQSTGTP